MGDFSLYDSYLLPGFNKRKETIARIGVFFSVFF